MEWKGIYQFINTSSSQPQTITWGQQSSLLFPISEFSTMDVLISIAGNSVLSPASVNFSVQENFSDAGFLETAKTGSLSVTGVYWLVHEGTASSGTIPSNIKMTSPLLGKGREKQVVVSYTGTPTSMAYQVYFIPYKT